MLFDEPTSDLDLEMIHGILAVLTALARDGMTMIVVMHEMAFARRITERVVFMDHGRIIEEGEAERFFDRPVDPRTRRFLSSVLAH